MPAEQRQSSPLLDGCSRTRNKVKTLHPQHRGGAVIGMFRGTSEDQGFRGQEGDQQDGPGGTKSKLAGAR